MRILNMQTLLSHGNVEGRKDLLDIMDTGLAASDPYYNTRKLVRLSGTTLSIGDPDFEATGDPLSGVDVYDIRSFEHIWIVGAGKGVQRVAKALEDELGEFLTGGHLICKYGDPVIMQRVGVTAGRHPTPDANCEVGSRKILEIAEKVTEKDLVFTIITNGGSSLMTLPVPGVSLEEVAELTQLMQIELGVPTRLLNRIRNHLDQLKGGKLARLFSKARLVNIAGADLNHADDTKPRDFAYFVENNCWLHNMPESSTFADACAVMDRYNAWDRCPASIREVLRAADPAYESVRYEEYKTYRQRMFGVTPEKKSFYKIACERARELGYTPYLLADSTTIEAKCVGQFLGSMAKCIESGEATIKAPAALVLTGEMIVTVGKSREVGGRNQECALALASRIAGSERILGAAADTDGTDGPGGFAQEGAPTCLSGGIVDGCTAGELAQKGIDIHQALNTHATTAALYNTDNAIHAEQGISVNDLVVVLVRAEKER
ncbi:MAG TPA: DUF4147 domain-containing protein [Candidatus Pullichristensenella stercorigallinarum]|uniref:DUF4147 domain-containing protein n=1 Tax=Candidatus Pullichristensenella stercorigallinarum TaxID=2840909 RepID=A0A9D0ZNG8_9FIRM|nr:DUF4147 domain-containing protein [Candidatus Pullichristensenella stercorigallinarum]